MEEEDNVFEIERVIDNTVTKGKRYYRVRWQGFDKEEDTWEPEENLFGCKDVLDKYWKENNKNKETKVKKRKSESTPQTSIGNKAKRKRKGRTTNNSTIARIDSTPLHVKKVIFTEGNEKTSSVKHAKTARKSISDKKINSNGKRKDTSQEKKKESKMLGNTTKMKKRGKAIDKYSFLESKVDKARQAKPVLDENQNSKNANSTECNSTSNRSVSPLQRENFCKSLKQGRSSEDETECNSTSTRSESPLQRGHFRARLKRMISSEDETECNSTSGSPLLRENSRENLKLRISSDDEEECNSISNRSESPLQHQNSREGRKRMTSCTSLERSPEFVPEYCDETLAYDICSEEEYEYFGDIGYLVKDSVGYEESDFEPTERLADDEDHVNSEGKTEGEEKRTEEENNELANGEGHTRSESKTEAVSPEEEIRTEGDDDELAMDDTYMDNKDKTEAFSPGEQIRTKKPKQRKEEDDSRITTASSLDTLTSIQEAGHPLSSSSSRNIGIKERVSPQEKDTLQIKKGDCEVTGSTATELFSKTGASKKSDIHSELNIASRLFTDETSGVLKTCKKDDITFTRGSLSGTTREKVDHARYPRKDELKLRTRLSSSDSTGLADNECMSPEFEPPTAFFDLAKKMDDGYTAETLTCEKDSKENELGTYNVKDGPSNTGDSCLEPACRNEKTFEESESISNAMVKKTVSVPDKDHTDILEKAIECDAQSVGVRVGKKKPSDLPQIQNYDQLDSVELKGDFNEARTKSTQDVDISQDKSSTDSNANVKEQTSTLTSLSEIDNGKTSTTLIENVVVGKSGKPDVSEVISDDIQKPSGSLSMNEKKNRTKLRLSLKRKSDQSGSDNMGKKTKQLIGSKEVSGQLEANTKTYQELGPSNQKLNKNNLPELRSDTSVCEQKTSDLETGEKVNYLVESVIAIKKINQEDLQDWSVNNSNKSREIDPARERIVESVGITQKLLLQESTPVCESYVSSNKKNNDESVESECTKTVKSVDHFDKTVEYSCVEKCVGNTQARSTIVPDESTVKLKDSTDSSTRVSGTLVDEKMKPKRTEDLVSAKSNSKSVGGDKMVDVRSEEKTLEKDKPKISRIGKFFQKIKNKITLKQPSKESKTDMKDKCLSSTDNVFATDRDELSTSVNTLLPSIAVFTRSVDDANDTSTATKNVGQSASNALQNIGKNKTHPISVQDVSTVVTSKRKEPHSLCIENKLDLKDQYSPAAEETSDLLTDQSSSDVSKDRMKRTLSSLDETSNIGHSGISVKKPSFSSIAVQNIKGNADQTTSIIFPNIGKDKTNTTSKQNISTSNALLLEERFSSLTGAEISPTVNDKCLPAAKESRALFEDRSGSQKLQDVPSIVKAEKEQITGSSDKKNIYQTTVASSVPVSLQHSLPSGSHDRKAISTIVPGNQRSEVHNRGNDSWSGDTSKTYPYSTQSSFQSANHMNQNPFLAGANPSLVSHMNQSAFLTLPASSPFPGHFNQQSFPIQPGNPLPNLVRQKPFSAVAGFNWYPEHANQLRPRHFRLIAPQPFVQRPHMAVPVPAMYPQYSQRVWNNNMYARALQEMAAKRAHPGSSTQSVSTSMGFNNKEYTSSIDADRAWYAKHVGSTNSLSSSQNSKTEPSRDSLLSKEQKSGENIVSHDEVKTKILIPNVSNNMQVSISESKGKDVYSSLVAEASDISPEPLSVRKHGESIDPSSSESCFVNEKKSTSKDNEKERSMDSQIELSKKPHAANDISAVDNKLKSNSPLSKEEHDSSMSVSPSQSVDHSPDTGKMKHCESIGKENSSSAKEVLKETSAKDTVSKLSGNGSLIDSKKPLDKNGCHHTDTDKKQPYHSKDKTKEKSEGKSTLNSESQQKSISRSSPVSKLQSSPKEPKRSNHKTSEKSENRSSSSRSGSREKERSRDSPSSNDREQRDRRNDSEKTRGKNREQISRKKEDSYDSEKTRGKEKEISRKKDDSSKRGSRDKEDDHRSKRDSYQKQDSLDSELEFDLDDYSPGQVVSEKATDVAQIGIPMALPLREVKSAIKQGDSSTVLASLAGGMNIDSQDSVTGMSLLTRAVSSGQENIVKLLLNRGANINIKDITGSTPLVEACEQGFENIVSLLLNAEIDINAKQTLSGETALIKACMKGHYNVVAMLLAHGADCQMRSVSGLTAAQLAVQCGHFEIRDLLESHNKKLQRCVETAIASCLCDSSKLLYPPLLPFVSLYPAEGQRFTYHFHCGDLLLSKTIVLFCLRAVFSRSGQVDLSFSKDNGVHTVLLNGSLQSPVLLNNKSVFVLQPKLETNRLILQTYQSHVHLLVCIYAAEMDENMLNIEPGPT